MQSIICSFVDSHQTFTGFRGLFILCLCRWPDVLEHWGTLANVCSKKHKEKGVIPPPKWWNVEDDWDLLKGVRRHGLDLKAILMDTGLRFYTQRARMAETKKKREATRRAKKKFAGEDSLDPDAGPDKEEDELKDDDIDLV